MTQKGLFTLVLATLAAVCETQLRAQIADAKIAAVTIPAGTPLPVRIGDHLPMRPGEPVRARLIYPVYVGERMALPAGTVVTGKVVSLLPDRGRRRNARLRADFTPFHNPVVQFDHVLLGDGTSRPLSTGTATDGAPIYRLVAPPPHKGGLASQQLDVVRQGIKDRIAVITGPDKIDRLTQLFWSQLPWHPERIARDTAWTVETAAPLRLPEIPASGPASMVEPPSPSSAERRPAWILQAYLNDSISSASSRANEPITASVAEPVLNPDGSVAVPVGSIMAGSVTEARPARWFSRAGTLRFKFGEIRMPGEQPVAVQAALAGADSTAAGELAMNSEGDVRPKPQDKLIVPFILLSLAARPLDRDGGRDHHMLGKDAVASNSLGFLGFLVGTAARQPNLAAGIGFYGSAISIYERIFHRGKEVAFARNTRIVIETRARLSAPMKPETASIP